MSCWMGVRGAGRPGSQGFGAAAASLPPVWRGSARCEVPCFWVQARASSGAPCGRAHGACMALKERGVAAPATLNSGTPWGPIPTVGVRASCAWVLTGAAPLQVRSHSVSTRNAMGGMCRAVVVRAFHASVSFYCHNFTSHHPSMIQQLRRRRHYRHTCMRHPHNPPDPPLPPSTPPAVRHAHAVCAALLRGVPSWGPAGAPPWSARGTCTAHKARRPEPRS